MGKASKALRQVLKDRGITQNKLATALGIEGSIISHWCDEQIDPTAETVAEIVELLQGIEPSVAENFIRLYLGYPSQIDEDEKTLPFSAAQELPLSNEVDVSTLSRLLEKTTTSYKYLFLISLLDILKRRQFDVSLPVGFKEIVVEMLANAWYPHTYFRLSFGLQDKIADKLDSLALEISEPILKFTDTDKELLRRTLEKQDLNDVVKYISRYVPFRIIRPFFEQEIARLQDDKVNQKIVDLSFMQFEKQPLYHFDSVLYKDCKAIILHEKWMKYIERNYSIIRAWVAWEWLNYMQQRNPNIPALVNKLFIPQARGSLDKQTKYWKLILERTSIKCIYSEQSLNLKVFSLDHYIPWSFVAHDQLWNLIPTLLEVNSSKSNNLPAQKYFNDFVATQHLGFTVSYEHLGEKAWSNYVETYIADLKVNHEDLLNIERLQNAYEYTLQPLLSLAEGQGFATNWSYL